MVSVELEFEWKQTCHARLDGLESVLAAVVELLMSDDTDMRAGLSRKLDRLERLMREQNAHLASIETVNRFQALVSEDISDPRAISWIFDE